MNPQNARKPAYGIPALAFAVLFLPALSYADIFKWTDTAGNVHFGDAPPQEVRTSAVNVQVTPPKAQADSVTSAQDMRARQERFTAQLHKERMQREKQTEKEQQQKVKFEETCLRARNRLEHMKTINVFYQENQDGTVHYLSDKEGDKVRHDMQSKVDQYCG